MLKTILYMGLTALSIGGTFISPLIGLIGCMEAYLLNPTAVIDSTFRFQFWTTVAFLASCLIRRPRGLPRVGREHLVLLCLWLFIAYAYLGVFFIAPDRDTGLDAIAEVFKSILFVSAISFVINDEPGMDTIITACLVGVLHASFMHVLGPRLGYVSEALGREEGVLPDMQTPVLLLFVPLIILLALQGTKAQRILAWITLPLAMDSIVTSYMRTGLVALAAEIVLLLLVLKKRLVLRLLPILFIGGALFFFRLTPENYWNWMSTIRTPEEEASANLRFKINAASWQMFLDHPMGVGYRNYPYMSRFYLPEDALNSVYHTRAAHSSIMTILCETGVPGLFFWFGTFGGAIFMLRRIRKRADSKRPSRVELYAMGLELGLYGWLVTGFFHSTHEVDPAYWFVGLAVVLVRLQYQQQEADSAESDEDVSEPAEIASEMS